MASERWNDIAYAMTPYKIISWPVGVWPLQVYNLFSLLRSIICICGSAILVILPPIEMYMGCTTAVQNVDCSMLSICGMLGIIKTIRFRIYANNLISNYKSAIHDYLVIDNIEERILMRKHALAARISTFPLLGFSYLIIAVYTLTAININHDKKNQNITGEDIMLEYPIPSKCAMNYFHAPVSMYSIFAAIQIISLIALANTNLGNDALFINITFHACAQMKILRTHFDNLDVTSPQIYDRFNELIQRHIYLIRLIRKLADVISLILLTEFFCISICICIMGFQLLIAMRDNDTVMVGQSLSAQIVFLVKLSVYSFIGNYLKSQMEDIGYSIYQKAWYEFPVKLMRNLIFILMQTDGPAMFQAGNFIPVNLSTLVDVLKTSFSYLSVLRIMIGT